MSITEIYEKMLYANEHIQETVANAKKENKKVIGVAPVFVPIELIHAAGMLPIGCWGGQAQLANAPTYLPSFACSVVQEMIELAARGLYDDLDGIIISCACDTLKCAGQNLSKILTKTKMIYCRYPQHNSTPAGKEFFLSELRNTKAKLEEIAGKKITNEALYNSIEIYNENRIALQDFVSIVAEKPGIISNEMRHNIIKSRFYMDIEVHTKLVKELNEELKASAYSAFNGKKVFAAGIMSEPISLLRVFDELDIAIIGDEMAYGTQQFRTLVPEGLDQLERLSDQWVNTKDTVFILDIGKKRAQYISRRAKELGADGIVFFLMMFCDLEEFDAPFIKKYALENEIPYLALDIQQNMQSVEQVRTRLQAFKEIIG